MTKMIREMEKSDWERVSEIYMQGLERGVSTFNTECPSYEEWDASHIKECRYVYEKDGNICGWISISPISGRSAYKGAVEVSIYVDNDYQNQGIGKSLMRKLCIESEKLGYWSIYAAIFSINTASIHLHKVCGFREIGYREKIAKDKFGEWQNTTLMERRSSNII